MDSSRTKHRNSAATPSPGKRTDPPNPQEPYLKDTDSDPSLSIQIPQPPHRTRSNTTNFYTQKSAVLIRPSLPHLLDSRGNGASDQMAGRPPHMSSQISEKYMRHESIFEAFLINANSMELYRAVEETIGLTLKASVTLWQDIPSLHVLFSETHKRIVKHSSGLVGETFFNRKIVKAQNCAQLQSYSDADDGPICPPKTPVLLFPLWDRESNVCSVVEVMRKPEESFFDSEDEDFINFFVRKYKIFSNWLTQVHIPHDAILELMQSMELEQFLILFQKKVPQVFKCSSAEIWKYNTRNKDLYRFTRDGVKVDLTKAGIVGEALTKEYPLNCAVNKIQSSYDSSVDGTVDESVLVVPLIDAKQSLKFAVALRGRKELPVFTSGDEALLRTMAPYLALALNNNEKFSQTGSSANKDQVSRQCVSSLAEVVAMLSDGVSTDDIVAASIEKVQLLINSDRAYLFFYDKFSECLKSKIATNCKVQLSIALDRGIVGKTYRGTKIYNIPDAYEDMEFDSSLDLNNGYRTKSLLSVPVLNNRKETTAVAQFLNKRDGKPFSNADILYVHIFTSYIGMILENEKMYKESSESSNQLRSFLNVSLALSSNQSVKTILADIMKNARAVIGAERASLFLFDDVLNVLSTYIYDGSAMPATIPLSHGLAATAAKTKESLIVNDTYHDPRFNKMIDYHTGFKTNSLIAVPVINSEGNVLGVVEMVNKAQTQFTQEDLKMLKSFATFASISLETRRLKDVTERGTAEIEMSKWIADFERPSYQVPTKLQIPLAKQAEVLSLDFFCIDWNGIGLFKIAFYVFTSFGLLEQFKIHNDLFFTFLFKLRESYNEPPYHNWIHAIDVLQYVAYQAKKCNLDNILSGLELLALCTAAICHDAGHQGFNNTYNVKSETPLGILFKDQSVMETWHCTVAIRIISQDESNIFKNLTPVELKKIWSWIVTLILATDMARHFKLVDEVKEIMKQGPINLSNEHHRIMALIMIMKVADISNVSRPFEIADNWCDVLCEEFFRQGDQEKSQGLELTSPMNDREKPDKAGSQIGFYNIICLPLYQAIARIFPELDVNAASVRSNLDKWNKLQEDEKKKESDESEMKKK